LTCGKRREKNSCLKDNILGAVFQTGLFWGCSYRMSKTYGYENYVFQTRKRFIGKHKIHQYLVELLDWGIHSPKCEIISGGSLCLS